ncbi:uncharacterized protein LOC141654825 [Silene latifolia]|uniref:uncharacterized protein LOC141654825 n=1 Tax=Silene latifolia TaxID=37657 RepID=UPI003D77C2B9
MSHIAKREFDIFYLAGHKFLQWKDDVIAHLGAKGLEHTVKIGNFGTYQEKQQAHIFIRHHMDEGLKNEYLRIRDSSELWARLEERFGHQQYVLLPKLCHEWENLCFQDFTLVNEYNSTLFRIASQLEYCGHEVSDFTKIEKTFSTMGKRNIDFQRQIRQNKTEKFTDLIAILLVAKQNDNVLLKNGNLRLSGSIAIPEPNFVARSGRGCWINKRGRGRGRGSSLSRGQNTFKKPHYGKRNAYSKNIEKPRTTYSKCGLGGHWARACCTPKRFVDLYQASITRKNNRLEAHFISDVIPLTSNMPKSNMVETDMLESDMIETANYFLDDGVGSSGFNMISTM